jgi:hypothetical protein
MIDCKAGPDRLQWTTIPLQNHFFAVEIISSVDSQHTQWKELGTDGRWVHVLCTGIRTSPRLCFDSPRWRLGSEHGSILKHQSPSSQWVNSRSPDAHSRCTFLSFAIQSGLKLYVFECLQLFPDAVEEKKGRTLLDYALRPYLISPVASLGDGNPDADIIEAILETGCEVDKDTCVKKRDGLAKRQLW